MGSWLNCMRVSMWDILENGEKACQIYSNQQRAPLVVIEVLRNDDEWQTAYAPAWDRSLQFAEKLQSCSVSNNVRDAGWPIFCRHKVVGTLLIVLPKLFVNSCEPCSKCATLRNLVTFNGTGWNFVRRGSKKKLFPEDQKEIMMSIKKKKNSRGRNAFRAKIASLTGSKNYFTRISAKNDMKNCTQFWPGVHSLITCTKHTMLGPLLEVREGAAPAPQTHC